MISKFVFLCLIAIAMACSDLTKYTTACPASQYCVASERESLYASCFDTKQRSPLFVVHKIVGSRCRDGKRCNGSWHVVSNDDHESHDAMVQQQGSGAAFADQTYQVWNALIRLTNYQRGHFAPAGDFRAIDSLCKATFATVNRAPQAGKLNGGKWAIMENAFRKVNEMLNEDLVIVTGAVYDDRNGKTTNEKSGLAIGVPVVMYKALYSEKNKAGIAAIAENTQSATVELVSLAQLKNRIGREVFADGLVRDETSVSWQGVAEFLAKEMHTEEPAEKRLTMTANKM